MSKTSTRWAVLRDVRRRLPTAAFRWVPRRAARLSAQTGLLAGLLLMFVLQFQLLRAILLGAHWDLAQGCGWREIAWTFVVGLPFDLATAAWCLIPLLALNLAAGMLWGARARQAATLAAAGAAAFAFWLLGFAEVEFYGEFFSRFNSLAVHYWRQPWTVLKIIWYGFPVLRYLAIVAAATAVQCWLMRRLARFWARRCEGRAQADAFWKPALRLALLSGMLVVLARGGVRGTPLKWGDAVHSESVFLNHLALNGMWTLGNAVLAPPISDAPQTMWAAPLGLDAAQDEARRLLFLPQDEPAGDANAFPLLRRHRRRPDGAPLTGADGRPPNVVVIIMESFTARFCGACGANDSDDDHTPQFNRLARHGTLFDRCFSAGTHTHQANVGVSANFPNLPGHEALMEDFALGSQPFESLPRACRKLGYNTWFFYNGALEWENMRGFYALQGVERFVDRDDFADRSRFDSTWGATDEQLFERVNRELKHARQPFQATVLTLSNHAPYEIPRPYPFPEVTDQGAMNRRMNSLRYADWALGRFFAAARKEDYFKNTLFVLVGDHGYSIAPILTELRLLRFHVPLLFYAPHLLGDEGQLRHTVVSQLDIAPTVLALLGDESPHQHWGRDLFSLPPDDPGFAVFKPSENSAEMGLARGDLLLIKSHERTRLYRYSLGFPASVTPLDDPPEQARMDRQLQGYVTTALDVLHRRHAGGGN